MRFLIFLLIFDLHSQVVLKTLPGQFGNNLYQFAAAISLAKKNNCQIHLPLFHSRIEDGTAYFPYPERSAAHDYYKTVYHRISQHVPLCQTHTRYVYRDKPTYSPIPYVPGIELDGYFQNENYFKDHRDLIRSIFSITEPIKNHVEKNFSEVLNHPKTVGIHVRTYYIDWLKSGMSPNFYESWLAPDLEFYKQAMAMFDDDSLFIVCSDHPDWCKKNLPSNCIVIENQEFIYDFFLLAKCKGMIISASTFGWWTAYLNEHIDCKVVYRNPFYHYSLNHAHSKNFINEKWIALDMPGVPIPIPSFD